MLRNNASYSIPWTDYFFFFSFRWITTSKRKTQETVLEHIFYTATVITFFFSCQTSLIITKSSIHRTTNYFSSSCLNVLLWPSSLLPSLPYFLAEACLRWGSYISNFTYSEITSFCPDLYPMKSYCPQEGSAECKAGQSLIQNVKYWSIKVIGLLQLLLVPIGYLLMLYLSYS